MGRRGERGRERAGEELAYLLQVLPFVARRRYGALQSRDALLPLQALVAQEDACRDGPRDEGGCDQLDLGAGRRLGE